jgi:hypothetical protein
MAGVGVKLKADPFKKVKRLKRGTGVTFTRFAPKVGTQAYNKHKAGFEADLKKYARKRRGQKYVRTFVMRRGWKTTGKTQKAGYEVDVINKTPYTHFVVGRSDMRSLAAAKKSQAKVHKGRWWLLAEKSRDWFEKIANTYKELYFDVLEDQAEVKFTRRSRQFKRIK